MRCLAAIALIGALGACPLAASANPFNLDLQATVLVEGSTRHKGIQPDYLISPDDPSLARLFRQAREIGRTERDYWKKVAKVRDLVAWTMPSRDYDDPNYLELVGRYRKRKQAVPLGAYVEAGAGVCREHYLLLHLALKHAGIDNEAVYAKVTYDKNGKVREDHGFVVLTGKGRGITVDSFNPLFDGLRLSLLTTKKGANVRSELAPSARRPLNGARRVMKVHRFPCIRSVGRSARR